jgi:deoxyribodipyrimidine photo-lyase
MFETGLFIFRRDLRIQDNLALNLAAKDCKKLYTIFIFTPEQISDKNKYKSDNSVQFMIESLAYLQSDIIKKGGSLNLFYGENNSIISKLIKKWKINAVFFNSDITPYSKKRDKSIETLCKKENIECITADDYYLYDSKNILSGSGEPYTKFTPYYNKVLPIKIPKPVILKSFPFEKSNEGNITLPQAYFKFTDPNSNKLVTGGRENGIKIINGLSKFSKYGTIRNDLDKETTLLSAYLKYGCISVREAYEKMKKVNKDLLRQLIWREFYAQILDNNPKVLGSAMKEKYNKIKWTKNAKLLNAWKKGQTGFPIVDAGMREMNTTGYMHNRARLITASFLIKTLLIDWEDGEKYFAQTLTDYDPASNNGNWQWVASTGADSQPYFRIFNPWSQSEKYDPKASYIKKWVPELRSVPAKDIHNWNTSFEKYKDVKYTNPIVNYEEQRQKALDMYKKVV